MNGEEQSVIAGIIDVFLRIRFVAYQLEADHVVTMSPARRIRLDKLETLLVMAHARNSYYVTNAICRPRISPTLVIAVSESGRFHLSQALLSNLLT